MYKRIATRQFKTAFQKPFSKLSCIVIILFVLYQLAQNCKFKITRKKSRIKKKCRIHMKQLNISHEFKRGKSHNRLFLLCLLTQLQCKHISAFLMLIILYLSYLRIFNAPQAQIVNHNLHVILFSLFYVHLQRHQTIKIIKVSMLFHNNIFLGLPRALWMQFQR